MRPVYKGCEPATRAAAVGVHLGTPYARPGTQLIESEQLEPGEALDDNFRAIAGSEIERFRREIVERTGDQRRAEDLTAQEILPEVMNTVEKQGGLW